MPKRIGGGEPKLRRRAQALLRARGAKVAATLCLGAARLPKRAGRRSIARATETEPNSRGGELRAKREAVASTAAGCGLPAFCLPPTTTRRCVRLARAGCGHRAAPKAGDRAEPDIQPRAERSFIRPTKSRAGRATHVSRRCGRPSVSLGGQRSVCGSRRCGGVSAGRSARLAALAHLCAKSTTLTEATATPRRIWCGGGTSGRRGRASGGRRDADAKARRRISRGGEVIITCAATVSRTRATCRVCFRGGRTSVSKPPASAEKAV